MVHVRQGSSSSSNNPLAGSRVLVCERDRDVRHVLARILERAGAAVDASATGPDAAGDGSWDVIVAEAAAVDVNALYSRAVRGIVLIDPPVVPRPVPGANPAAPIILSMTKPDTVTGLVSAVARLLHRSAAS